MSGAPDWVVLVLLIVLGGIHFAGAAVHLLYSRIWDWATDLEQLKPVNRQAALAMNGMVAYLLGFFGLVDLLWAFRVVEREPLLVVAIIGYWVARMILQLIYYDMRQRLSQLLSAAFIFMIVGHISLLG